MRIDSAVPIAVYCAALTFVSPNVSLALPTCGRYRAESALACNLFTRPCKPRALPAVVLFEIVPFVDLRAHAVPALS